MAACLSGDMLAARKTLSRRLRRPAGEDVRLRRPLSQPFG